MNFCSDNVTGVAPEIMAALTTANETIAAMPYGDDPWTGRLDGLFSEIFEREVAVFPVATGTAANVLGLALFTPPYGAIYCHTDSHIVVDECGAPELYTGGAKLVDLPGADGKLSAGDLDAAIGAAGAGDVHHVQPAAISITQATEAGTVYSLDEVAAIGEVANKYGLALHMDGARFANAVAGLGCTPAATTWQAGVDVLAFGATKNGALAAEAVVFFDPARAETFGYRRKRGGHLFSKMRFLSAQLEAYVSDGLWLDNARHANAMATRLGAGLAAVDGVRLLYPVDANVFFVEMPRAIADGLEADGFRFYRMKDNGRTTVRLVTAFNTRVEDVDGFVASAASHGAGARRA
ncbi:MAG: low specificity L-threonine aldolase [Alphaproteobacteria bacterium]|nr:low specificity L-threonine aldolase [Alphaproteobacteria bacterium]